MSKRVQEGSPIQAHGKGPALRPHKYSSHLQAPDSGPELPVQPQSGGLSWARSAERSTAPLFAQAMGNKIAGRVILTLPGLGSAGTALRPRPPPCYRSSLVLYQSGSPQWSLEGLAGTSSLGHAEGPWCPGVVGALPVARVLKTA